MSKHKDIKDDLEKYSALDSLRHTEGGQVLIKSYVADIIASIDALATGYRSMTHVDMVARCAGMAERLDVLRTLLNARTNQELADEALREALLADPEPEPPS